MEKSTNELADFYGISLEHAVNVCEFADEYWRAGIKNISPYDIMNVIIPYSDGSFILPSPGMSRQERRFAARRKS